MSDNNPRPVRVVHVDPEGFGDVTVEQRLFERAFPGVRFDSMELTGGQLAQAVGPADILLTHYTPVDSNALDAIQPQVIVRYATGVDGIDMDVATARGIRVINIPTYCDDEVADHVLAMALALIRGLPQYSADAGRGGWSGRRLTAATAYDRKRSTSCTGCCSRPGRAGNRP